MFFFGDPRSTADLFYDDMVRQEVGAPEMLRMPPDELTEQEMRNLLAWVFWAHQKAEQEDLGAEVLEVIEMDYIQVMCNLALVSEEYAGWVTGNAGRYINQDDPEKKQLYKRLVETTLLTGSAP